MLPGYPPPRNSGVPHPTSAAPSPRRPARSGCQTALRLAALSAALASLALGVTAVGPQAGDPRGGPDKVRVLTVLDGDTLRLRIGESEDTVRLIGVDCPEVSHPTRPPEFFGEEATEFVRRLVEKKPVTLAADPYSQNRDKYGRLLRYVTLPDAHPLNALLIEQGYCYALTRFPFARRSEFVRLEAAARRAERGLWKDGGLEEMRWVEKDDALPFTVYPMTRQTWGVRYGDRVRVRLSNTELHRALNSLRRWSVELSPGDLEKKMANEGWRRLSPAR